MVLTKEAEKVHQAIVNLSEHLLLRMQLDKLPLLIFFFYLLYLSRSTFSFVC